MKRALLALVAVLAGCAYYNAMWRAEQFAKEARRLEARGRAGEAKLAWARATTKAESVLARHPRSRWADDALVLKGEGLARSGDCAAAVAPLEQARRTVTDPALFERASLAAAECALAGGDPGETTRLLGEVLESRDGARRSRAAYLAGRAAWAGGDAAGALQWFGRSDVPGALLARARALIAVHRVADALDLMAGLGRSPGAESEWAALLDTVARAAGPETASLALDRLLAGARVPAGVRGRLVLADADRLRAAGRAGAAAARYGAVAELVPDSLEGALAVVRQAAVHASLATDAAALDDVMAHVTRDGADSRGREERQALAELLGEIRAPHREVARALRAAELARDSLQAPRLAGWLFLHLARRHPESLFAPKALIAALALDAGPRDSILTVLRSQYAASPYTLALGGVASPAYAVAEDSLGRALGVGAPAALAAARSPVPPPVPGPRGPFLDAVFRPAPDAGGASVGAPRPGRQPPRARDREPVPRDREPVE